MGINVVAITGNLTRDPQLRQTSGGTAVLEIGVAVNERTKDQASGEWSDRPNFVDCTVFGARASSLSKILHKGDKVAVRGRLHYSSWEKDGQKCSKLDVIADDIDLMQKSRHAAAQAPKQPPVAATPAQFTTVQTPPSTDVFDEDIPF